MIVLGLYLHCLVAKSLHDIVEVVGIETELTWSLHLTGNTRRNRHLKIGRFEAEEIVLVCGQ